jgi:hypothetical protein
MAEMSAWGGVEVTILCAGVESTSGRSAYCSSAVWQVAEFPGGYEFVDTKLREAGLGTEPLQ